MNTKKQKKTPRSGGGQVRADEGCEAINRPQVSSRKDSLAATHQAPMTPAQAWVHIRDTANAAGEINQPIEALATELSWPTPRVRRFLSTLRKKKYLAILIRRRTVLTIRGSKAEWPPR